VAAAISGSDSRFKPPGKLESPNRYRSNKPTKIYRLSLQLLPTARVESPIAPLDTVITPLNVLVVFPNNHTPSSNSDAFLFNVQVGASLSYPYGHPDNFQKAWACAWILSCRYPPASKVLSLDNPVTRGTPFITSRRNFI